jgi:phenylalanyl-tRNA synthetase alpha chain
MSTYDVEGVKQSLLEKVALSDTPRDVLKAPEIRELYSAIGQLPAEARGAFGKQVNEVKLAIEAAIEARENELESADVQPLDITAPWDVNSKEPQLLPTEHGTQHPLTKELEVIVDIFTRMGFEAIESRQIDDDHHMFGALNFPADHPARDG